VTHFSEPGLLGYLLGPVLDGTAFYLHAAAAVAAGEVVMVRVGLATAVQDLAGRVPDRVDSAALAEDLQVPVDSGQADLFAAFA
jgi:hypothetical protein